MSNRALVRSSVIQCRACGLSDKRTPVPFSGPDPARVVVIGEAPGKKEDELRQPFVGPSGGLVRAWLTTAGFELDDVAFVNVVSCYPERTPTGAEVSACSVNLLAQLQLLQPSFCLLLGGVALSAWWDGVRIGEARGLWWKDERVRSDGPWMLATWHPSAVLRNNSLGAEAQADVFRFRGGVKRPWVGDSARGMGGIVLPAMCVKGCGEWADTFLNHSGGADGYGFGWCEKHYAQRIGSAGGGREKKVRARKEDYDVKEKKATKAKRVAKKKPSTPEGLWD